MSPHCLLFVHLGHRCWPLIGRRPRLLVVLVGLVVEGGGGVSIFQVTRSSQLLLPGVGRP